MSDLPLRCFLRCINTPPNPQLWGNNAPTDPQLWGNKRESVCRVNAYAERYLTRRVWALLAASVGVIALSGASAQTQGKPEGAKQSAGKNVTLTGQKSQKGVPSPTISAENVTFFESKIRPLLAEKCYACHGDTVQQSGLRLNTPMGLRKGSSTGAVVIAGKPEESALIRAIHYDGAIKMPPTGKLSPSQIADLTEWVAKGAFWPEAVNNEVTSKEATGKSIGLNAGQSSAFPYPAARKNFWSFLPVKNAPLPAVKNMEWCKNPIDRFILAGLEAKGLKPAPAADRRTLIRRATFDMTGLPPTPEEVAAFAADKSPDAWAKVVDRLLASPRYGERWGRHWLDLVRYADSYDARGVGGDGDISEAWRYRDWVVSAFNSDMPYSQFMKYQVAGDLIPSAEKQGVIATGMLAIGNWGNGDADKDKIITDIADDQVDVISRSMMGLTVACARCHDHKFDPIPTKDYYGLAGMFFSSHILPHMASKGAGESPLHIPLITATEQEQRALYVKQVAEGNARLQQERNAQLAAYALQMLPRTAAYVQSAWQYEHRPAAQSGQTLETFAKEKNLQVWALRQWRDYLVLGDYPLMLQASDKVAGFTGLSQWRGAADCPNMLINSSETPRTITTLTIPGRSVAVHPGPNNGVVVAWRSPINGTVRITGHVIDADPNGGDGIAWAVDHRSRTGVQEIASGDFPNGGKQDFVMGRNAANLQSVAVKQGDRLEFIVLPKENYVCDTTIIDATITEAVPSGANASLSKANQQKENQTKENHVWNLTRDVVGDALQGGKGNPHADSYGNAAIWHFEDMADRHRGSLSPSSPNNSSSGELAIWRQAVESLDGRMIDTETVRQASEVFARAFAERTTKEGPAGSAKSPFHINSPADEAALPPAVRSALEQQTAQLEALKKNAPPPVEMALGIQEGGIPDSPHAGIHDIKVHIRGSYARLGDMVPRHLPIILAGDKQTPITQGSGRLQLADWLASDSHTLTPRVWVNRVWQHHFGQGIVRTPSNFGF